nr:MAG TPA: hypothetical protein [Caudoviricetes sp.]
MISATFFRTQPVTTGFLHLTWVSAFSAHSLCVV